MKRRDSKNAKSNISTKAPSGFLLANGKLDAVFPAANGKASSNHGNSTGSRKPCRKRIARDLSDGLPPYLTVQEFAAFAHVHPRTITRDIDDGLLIATEFRGARRISREDGRAYLRKSRSKVGHSQRRRSPRKAPNKSKSSNGAENP